MLGVRWLEVSLKVSVRVSVYMSFRVVARS